MKFFNINGGKGIFTLVFLVLLVNLISVYFYDLHVMRIVRFGSTFSFILVYFYLVKNQNLWVTLALFLLVCRDFAHIFFESDWGTELYLFFAGLSYTLFCVERIPFVRLSGFKKSSLLFAALLTSGNILILYILSGFVEGQMQDLLELPLFYFLGSSLIVLVSCAFYYNFVLNSNRSLYFALMVFGFILADISACLAYYNEFDELWYVDRFFYALSLGFLMSFTIDTEGLRTEQEDIKILKDSF
ncbi:hypothetical protein DSM03_10170 [Leeuwenhoekiella aestuarii]|uniref:YhhN-like protein n=1 Tax=Leeuwenhoekiella aestuarii TaxID=2249426 RepID=A0A4Q0NSD2_9FLAO|nr:hypothetical protein [Leeuwenhoekiella aestuarii]RXG13959.1 hypothetical protein DSM04_10463 [Leeuwenhoekiella aestuarii]RXG18706.1 hypothetical protein DSM03_10170 [Leeuwenhoekiella aestuarii]